MAERFQTDAALRDLVTGKLKTMQSSAKQSFDKMATNAGSFNKGLEGVASKVVNLKNLLIGLAAVKSFQSLISKTAQLGDKFDKLSFRLGVSTKFLQELDFAANLAGTSVDEMQSGIRRLSKSASDVQRGLKVAKDAFDDLGIEVLDENGILKETEVLFGEVVNALGEVESSTKRVALSQEILGRSGTALLPLVAAGADAFEKAKQEANDLGVVMDEKTLKATVDYTDAMFRMNAAVKGQLIKTMIPTVRKLADIMQGFIDRGGFDQWSTQIQVLTAVGKALLITYSVTKFTSIVAGFKAIGTASEVAAIKAARAQAVMNGLKFAGIIAIIAAVQFAFDELIKVQEKITETNNKMADAIGGSDRSTVVRLIELRKEFDRLKSTGQDTITTTAAWGVQLTTLSDAMVNLNKETLTLQQTTFDQQAASGRTVNVLQAELKIIDELARRKKEAGDAGGSGRGLTKEQIEKALKEEEAFQTQLAAIRESNLQASFEGRNTLIEENRSRALSEAFFHGEGISEIDTLFDRQREENFQAHKDELQAIQEQHDKDSFDSFQKELDAEVDALNKLTAQKKIINDVELADKKKLEANKMLLQQQSFDAAFAIGNALVTFGIANAKVLKKIQLVESIIQGVGAVQKALNTPPPFNFALAAFTGIAAAANTAVIASQAFEQGGFPAGNNSLIKVNERGQEAVLNAGAVRDIGVGNINAMNSGQGLNKSIVNEITYSPTIEVTGEAPRDIIDVLREDKDEFAKFFKEDVVERGFLE